MTARRDMALTIALRSYQAGQYEPARQACQGVLDDNPNDPLALQILGQVAYGESDFVDAESQFRLALTAAPDDPMLLNELGRTLTEQMRVEEAVGVLERAVSFAPDLAELRNSLGHAYHRLGDMGRAIPLLRKALELKPDYLEALINLGVALREDGHPDEGASVLSKAEALDPKNAEVAVQMGVTLQGLGQLDDAFVYFERAVAFDPSHAVAQNLYGARLVERGRAEQGEDHLRRAISLRPDYADALANLAAALLELGRLEEALKFCDQALALAPDSIGGHWNRALVLLTQGNSQEGYDEYEWRWKLPHYQSLIRDRGCPAWDGGVVKGMRLQLHSEQGFGDVIQFGRYAPYLAAQGMKITLEVQKPLVTLMQGMDGDISVISLGQIGENIDVHAPIMSLPRFCGAAQGNLLGETVPYIKPNPDLVDRVGLKDGLSVGICWQGSKGYAKDSSRSIPLKMFAPLADVPGLDLYCLQKGEGRDQIDDSGVAFAGDIGPELGDFPETAALMSKLDVVISVDTAMGHLAAALGRPTCYLLAKSPDWRWTLEGTTSPWYPTVKLYRQNTAGDWTPVIESLIEDLARKAQEVL